MTSTIVRVKRRLEESPLEAVVLHCKKFRKDENTELSPSVFIFSGTVNEEDNNSPHIKKEWLQNHDAERTLKATRNVSDIINKLKEEHKDSVISNRLKVINYSRGLSLCPEDIATGSENTDYTLLDLHDSKDDEEKLTAGREEKFAYDVYLSQQRDFDFGMLDDIVRIDPYSLNSLYMSFRDNGNKSSDDEEQDDDSNDENNYRNDYPDTDADDDSINENDMANAMRRISLDELSSEDDYDKMDDEALKMLNKNAAQYGLSFPAHTKTKRDLIDGRPSLIEYEDDVDDSYSAEGSRSGCSESDSHEMADSDGD